MIENQWCRTSSNALKTRLKTYYCEKEREEKKAQHLTGLEPVTS